MNYEQSSAVTRSIIEGETENPNHGTEGAAQDANGTSTSKQMAVPYRIQKRFWQKTEIRADDECWPWNGGSDINGYGRFRFDGTTQVASRMAFLIHHGRWPTPACLHNCDNGNCVNPFHIREGTQAENVADMISRGRYGAHRGAAISAAIPKGERHYMAKLTTEQVIEMRQLFKSGIPPLRIAKEFQIKIHHTRAILNRKTWKHIP